MFPRKLFSSSRKRRGSDRLSEPNRDASPTGFASRKNSIDSETTLLQDGRDKSPDRRATSPAPSSKHKSKLSSTTLSVRSKSPRPDRGSDPLGLNLLHKPEGEHVADIIFVHGLGGSSRLSWCKNKDLALFWPKEWLPFDADLQGARIFTFGYNASFLTQQSATLGISDFAKNLLYDLLYGRDSDGQDLRFGHVPIVFVTHSMGGLVFKKAYLDAKLDSRYEAIVQSIKAAVFIATPHRGVDLSEFLGRLLSISFLTSWKQYISELRKDGPFLRLINDQFRQVATHLQVFSFYETLPTQVGPVSTIILDGESSKLGYPAETSRALNADHHNVCKFDGQQDPNYLVVVGALKALVTSFADSEASEKEVSQLRDLLSLSGSIDHDLDHFWARRAEGTCDWIMKEPVVANWASSPSTSEVLWIHGRPARGKSVLSSFLARRLSDEGALVQYFFFRAGDESKRTIGSLLKSLAFQTALQVPAYRTRLSSFARGGGYKPKEADWKLTWKKLFTDLLFQIEAHAPLYWIIDGLDESASPQHLLELLSEIGKSATPVRVLLTSRWNPVLASTFPRMNSKVSTSALSIDNDATDIRIYVEEELCYLMWSSEIKNDVRAKILELANDNFLWVYLILEELKDCHTEADLRDRLSELPAGMEALYGHMEDGLQRIKRPSDRSLARQLFLWAIYAKRSLSVDELASILQPDFGRLLDLPNTIHSLCGQFVVLEGNNRVALLHQTAREYLTSSSTLPFSLEAQEAHKDLFKQSMNAFLNKNYRSATQVEPPSLFEYRARAWTYHLGALEAYEDSDDRLDILVRFFSQQSVLLWIQILAAIGQLRVLIEASHTLHSFIQRRRKKDAAREPAHRRFEDLEFLETWSRDLLKLPGKFGSILYRDPDTIFTCIAAFCPQSSAIYKTFRLLSSATIRVKGVSEDWDDRLARVSIGTENQASLLTCSGRYVAVVNNLGTITIWDTDTFQQLLVLEHGERVSSVCFNSKGDCLASYGFRTTKVWSCLTGQVLKIMENNVGTGALCLSFANRDMTLLMGSDHRSVMNASLENKDAKWEILDDGILTDVESLEGTYMNSPTALAISPDGQKIAATFRRFPMTVWSLSSPARVIRRLSRMSAQFRNPNALPFASRISWHPNSNEILGILLDGCSFRLNIADGTYKEMEPEPGRMPADIHCSPDGTVFAIRGVQGTIKLYDYESWTLIYQLSSEDTITAFSFSPDGRRFYDIRGSCCNIWEPNILIRLSFVDDQAANSSQAADESSGRSNLASESFTNDRSRIKLTSPIPHSSLVCVGDEEGMVELVDIVTDKRYLVAQTATRLAIEHVSCSDDGKHFCYCEISGRVSVIEVQSTESGWKHRRIARFKPDLNGGRISQLLLSWDSRNLLVASKDLVQLWNLDPVSLLQTAKCSISSPKWVVHTFSREHLISATPNRVVLHQWTGLKEVLSWAVSDSRAEPSAQLSRPALPKLLSDDSTSHLTNAEETVERIHMSQSHGHVIITIGRRVNYRRLRSRFLIFEAVPPHSQDDSGTLKALNIPDDVARDIERPLDVIKGERLVYIDRSFGICSWPLRSGRGIVDVHRHFFIPRDWLADQDVELLHFTASGSILCPHNGNITILETTIGSDWC
ncbi:hypothetical protein VTK73DRAFT_7997 [Phialemonium thermophilum]|uniref:Uncharacterized protein n=1 Tax=Phialemonium thermophilum TaxID=223376 RepID=A0ABR3XQ43_9PEZI